MRRNDSEPTSSGQQLYATYVTSHASQLRSGPKSSNLNEAVILKLNLANHWRSYYTIRYCLPTILLTVILRFISQLVLPSLGLKKMIIIIGCESASIIRESPMRHVIIFNRQRCVLLQTTFISAHTLIIFLFYYVNRTQMRTKVQNYNSIYQHVQTTLIKTVVQGFTSIFDMKCLL